PRRGRLSTGGRPLRSSPFSPARHPTTWPVAQPVVIRWTTTDDLGTTEKPGGQPCGSRSSLLTGLLGGCRVPIPQRNGAVSDPEDDRRLRPKETHREVHRDHRGGRTRDPPSARHGGESPQVERLARWSGEPFEP